MRFICINVPDESQPALVSKPHSLVVSVALTDVSDPRSAKAVTAGFNISSGTGCLMTEYAMDFSVKQKWGKKMD